MSSNYVSRHPTQQSVTKEQILQYLEKRPQSNRYAMAKHFSCSPSAIEDRLLSLIATGEVSRVMESRTYLYSLGGYKPYVGEIVKPRTWEFKPMTSYRCANPHVDASRLTHKFGSGLR